MNLVYYENGDRWLIIKLEEEITPHDFIQVFKIIRDTFPTSDVEFKGWLYGTKVISMEDSNYRVVPFNNMIKLELTTDKMVGITNKQKKYYDKYMVEIRNL